jgi:hypothetical protein
MRIRLNRGHAALLGLILLAALVPTMLNTLHGAGGTAREQAGAASRLNHLIESRSNAASDLPGSTETVIPGPVEVQGATTIRRPLPADPTSAAIPSTPWGTWLVLFGAAPKAG